MVVHTAALHALHLPIRTAGDFTAVNVTATAELLAATEAAGAGRSVLTSSTSVYGHALRPREAAVWVTEDLTLRPRDVYDTTKLVAESLVRDAASLRLTTVVLRVARCFPEPFPVATWHRLHRSAGRRRRGAGAPARRRLARTGHLTCNVAAGCVCLTRVTVPTCGERPPASSRDATRGQAPCWRSAPTFPWICPVTSALGLPGDRAAAYQATGSRCTP